MAQATRKSSSQAESHPRGAALTVFRGPGVREYQAQIWRTAGEIDLTAWDCLRDRHDLFMDVRLLQAVEQSMARDADFRYVLFRDRTGAPAASACLCTYSVDSTVLAEEGLMRRIGLALKRVSPALVRYKVLFCGMPFSGGQSHVRFADGVDHRQIVSSLDAILSKVAREDGAKCIVWKEFQDAELPALATMIELRYRRADSLPMNQFRVQHADFDSYLASLHNKKRYEIRKSQKKFEAGGLRMITTSDSVEIDRLFTADVHRMYAAVVARSDTKFEFLPPEFFREMVRKLPDHCEMCFALEGDKVRGFGLCLHTEREYHPLFLGVDYEQNRDFDLYFNLMYRSLVDAMRNRSALVLLGQNADQCKTIKLGSHQTARHFYVRGVGFVMESVVRLLFNQLFPPRPLTAPVSEPEPARPAKSA
jgi:predicted N-acyltransferase